MATNTPTTAQKVVTAVYQAVAYPNDKPSNVHPAHEGPPADGEAAPSGREDKAKYIKSQGSIGGNADDGGLKKKALNQQEIIAERSRLQQAGLFAPHTSHEDMKNISQEHRDVAEGTKVADAVDEIEEAEGEKLV